jgi:predicted nucleotidyltransferase
LIDRSPTCANSSGTTCRRIRRFTSSARARGDARWNSDFDLWIDADIDPSALARLGDMLEESFVPFHVDFVTTRQLADRFGAQVRSEARQWM